jgi:uncharacterized repeat protein (TIGR03803 family)
MMAYIARYVLGILAAFLLSLGSAGATSFTTLYSVTGSSDGAGPTASLIHVGGIFYGTTFAGGTPGYGTVFSINPATGAETVLYSFAGGTDGTYPVAALLIVDGTLSVARAARTIHRGCRQTMPRTRPPRLR